MLVPKQYTPSSLYTRKQILPSACSQSTIYFENKQILNLKEYSILKITLKHIELLSGKYFFCIGLNNEEAVTYDYLENAACIHIFSNKGDLGVARITSEWDLQ